MSEKKWLFIMNHVMLTKRGRKIVMPMLALCVISCILLAGVLGEAVLLLCAAVYFGNVIFFNHIYDITAVFKESIGFIE